MTNASRRTGWTEAMGSLASPPFIVCCLALVFAAAGLRPFLGYWASRFEKLPIPLRKPLDHFDFAKLRSFEHVSLPSNEQPDLGKAEAMDALFAGFQCTDRKLAGQAAGLLITYYSNPRDNVPHTPEVCYRQGTTTVEGLTTLTLDTPELGPRSPRTAIRMFTLHQPHSDGVVLYCFYASGQLCHDREQVRWRVFRPGDRRVYFSKIEARASFPIGENPSDAIETCKRLLREALPILIQEHFPEDAQLK